MGDVYYDGSTYYGEIDLKVFLVWYLMVFGVSLLISLATYILRSVSMYTIAKRRCIRKPWLAWIPVGDLWILGSISDQFRYVTRGQVKNKRKVLLILEIVAAALGIFFSILIGAFLAQAIAYDDTMFGVDPSLEMEMIGTLMGAVGVGLIISGVRIASAVFLYMADYDLYRSCEPKNAGIYLVLSILFGITRPIFMLVCCKKDEGMPPRKAQSAPAPEVLPQPVEPAEEPEMESQPEVEPWDGPAEE